MIKDIKALAEIIGFKSKENVKDIYIKKYPDGYSIEIDFQQEIIHYGDKIICESKTTQNFSQAENFVVLECVNRLLENGCKPDNIVLEPTWKLGHQEKGRLDILVKKEDKAHLMIECKTFGKEFDNELKNMKKDGGQLFSYFQQDKNTNFLMLYASTVHDKQIDFKNEFIVIKKEYREAATVKDFFTIWDKQTKNGWKYGFESLLHNIEIKKFTKKDLIELSEEASSKIFHEFASILRKHSVSDKPNAFNKIFNLFLAKLYDEAKGDEDELEFHWREDDHPVLFQVRLINLHRDGLNAFLEKEIEGIQDSDFKYESKEELLDKKKKVLKFNNILTIKEVLDEESFNENQRVLKDVVKLLEKYQIRYPRKQQHLSDFFEKLLTTGLKQEVGQYFTPPPITKFIVRSLPIKEMILQEANNQVAKLPAVIDYAAGSGHFITEVMEEYQDIIKAIDIEKDIKFPMAKNEVSSWQTNPYNWAAQYVYGIEKDYRLAKVAKVGCYFYGDGVAQIIHGDGLDSFETSKTYKGLLKDNKNLEDSTKAKFSLVLSNPPYAVDDCKDDLEYIGAQNDFTLYKYLSDKSNNIECLFVERTKHLLKDNGIASIILPSSILNNTGIQTKTREIILQYFDIVGITELGSNTFMATGTNTVILFLRRRNNYESKNLKLAVETFFTTYQDVTLNSVEYPVSKYVNHVWNSDSLKSITLEDYISLLRKEPNKTITEHPIYKEYQKGLKNDKEFWTKLLEIEKEKIFYFIITYPQKVVLVKSGEKEVEKRFLGYKFTDRRGSEGIHPIQRGKNIEECTQLFDAEVFDNPTKASTYIYKAFAGDYDFPIDEAMQSHVTRYNLVDMITFDRVTFEKTISLSVKKKVKIKSKWEMKKLGEICEIFAGGDIPQDRFSKNENQEYNIPIYSNGIENDGLYGYTDKPRVIKQCITISARGTIGFTKQRLTPFYPIVRLLVLIPNKNLALVKFLEIILNEIEFEQYGIATPQLTVPQVSQYKIPLPPLDIQQKIVSDIEVLEEKEKKAKGEVEQLKIKSTEIFNSNVATVLKRLENICDFKAGDFVKVGDISKETKENLFPCYGAHGLRGYVKTFTHEGKYSLVGRQGALCGNVHFVEGKFHATEHALVAKPLYDIDTDWLYYKLVAMNLNQYATGTAQPGLSIMNLKPIELNVPPLSEQQKIVSEIKKIEIQIAALETEIAHIPKQKEGILKKYL